MGSVLVGIGVKTVNGVMYAIRVCFKSVCDHPFLVGFLCFLLFLYRSFPFMFSLLVSASPILFCTAILLGTLLSYGEPNIPEIELEEAGNHESVEPEPGIKAAGVSEIETIENFSADDRVGEGLDVHGDDGNCDANHKSSVSEENFRDVELSDGGECIDSESRDGGVELGLLGSSYGFVKLNDQVESGDDEKSEASSFDSESVNVDSLDSLPHSPWRRFQNRDEDEDDDEMGLQGKGHENGEDYDTLDSGSDHAESSSPDASMADIMPMLDELHPLLDEEAPQPLDNDVCHEGSDAASERTSADDDESETPDELEEAAEDENEEEEDEEEEEEEDGHGEKEEQTKSAIAWTEEDQKNLMDLGSSEMERNQRLENLIMRRRARKNTNEMNLIELEGFDLAHSIAPISTRRQNPFDVVNDSSDITPGLPPVPGSAPSILLPRRRNPFDIPYDAGEEKPNLTDEFQDELSSVIQPKEAFFRRHESFNVGPSIFGVGSSRMHEASKMRPYFVPERRFGEDSYSPLRRELSEVSESRVSSIPDSGSQASLESESQELRLKEVEVAVTETKQHVTDEDPVVNPDIISEAPLIVSEEHVHPETAEEEEEDAPTMRESGPSVETELVLAEDESPLLADSKMEHVVSEHVGHGSQSSSSDEDPPMKEGEVEVERGDMDKENAAVRHSSSSSLSEGSERIFVPQKSEGRIEPVIDHPGGLSSFPDPHREPVYDSSPREIDKNLSSVPSNAAHPEAESALLNEEVRRSDQEVSFEGDRPELNLTKLLPVPLDGEASDERDAIIIIRSPDSDADVYHEASEKLITTPSAEGNTSLFYDKALHGGHRFKHISELKGHSKTAAAEEHVEPPPPGQKPDVPLIQEVDQDIIQSNVESPLSPDFVSSPSAATEADDYSHSDIETTQKRDDDDDDEESARNGFLHDDSSVAIPSPETNAVSSVEESDSNGKGQSKSSKSSSSSSDDSSDKELDSTATPVKGKGKSSSTSSSSDSDKE